MGYVGWPETIWADLLKLPPAGVLELTDRPAKCGRFWQPGFIDLPKSPDDRVDLVRHSVRQAVTAHLVSDVLLGALLSGGLDSAIVVALMSKQAGRAGGVRTFTAGFADSVYDERPAARLVAEHCRTDHTELLVRPEPAGALDRIVAMYDEPFADSSALPTWLICQAARQHVTVALAGDGGDEVFGGYQRYLARRLAQNYNRLPGPARKAASALAELLARPGERYGGGFAERLRRFAAYAGQVERCPELTRLEYFTAGMQEGLLRPDALEAVRAAGGDEGDSPNSGLDPAERAMRRDLVDYLPDDILVKVDRASMAVSLEARSPFLDHRVVEFMLALPAEWKLRGLTGKYLLKRFAAGILPAEVVNRPKHGFAVPLAGWFQPGGEGCTRLEALSRGPLGRLVRKEGVGELLERHATGRADLGEHLWALTMLGMWLEGEGGVNAPERETESQGGA